MKIVSGEARRLLVISTLGKLGINKGNPLNSSIIQFEIIVLNSTDNYLTNFQFVYSNATIQNIKLAN